MAAEIHHRRGFRTASLERQDSFDKMAQLLLIKGEGDAGSGVFRRYSDGEEKDLCPGKRRRATGEPF
jgi:hypothetical protein